MVNKSTSVFFTDDEKLEPYSLQKKFAEHLEYSLVKDKTTVTKEDAYKALAMSIRDKLIKKWLRTQQEYSEKDVKKVYYLSLEFLMGSLLGNSLINLGYYDDCFHIMKDLGYILEDIAEFEHDMGLGNGGLGRLAACFLDSLSTLQYPAYGYGIRYEYGIFEQDIQNGYQVEKPDQWLYFGNPWEIIRPELTYRIRYFGHVESTFDDKGHMRLDWMDTEDVFAVACDIPIPGYMNNTVNNLRLWQAKSTNEFNLKDFNRGDYMSAVEDKNKSEVISKVLYPNDSFISGKMLRLQQQYFFVSATMQDIIKGYKKFHKSFKQFSQKVAVQLNDTHPSIAIPELMRILIDDEGLGWEEAWDITVNTFAYTNHTVVPEALEVWSVNMFGKLLPRHLQIIYEINHRFLEEIRNNYTTDDKAISNLSIINENGKEGKSVRMANLSIVGSHSVNGVAALHTEILKKNLFSNFFEYFPKKFVNVTNGITQRRWLRKANPFLSGLISDRIGDSWITDLLKLKELETLVNDDIFKDDWRNAKWIAKRNLISYIEKNYDVKINHESMFDVQVKRFHEYKRQLLNVLHVITLYNRIKDNPEKEFASRTILFSGKAAPSYFTAKLHIKLINSISDIINNDKDIGDRLKVLFLKNYSVSLAELIFPASDLSEQISTAGYEASGTGNMKFALNGALTIGTMDGANIEILEEVGKDNIFIFGLKAEEISTLIRKGYNPREYYENNAELKRAIDMLKSNYFNKDEPGIFDSIYDDLLNNDFYCLLADYQSYIDTQEKVNIEFINKDLWTVKSILNVARIGKFSSDRAIKEYVQKIWKIKPIKIKKI